MCKIIVTQTYKGFNNVTVHYFSKKQIRFQIVLKFLQIAGRLLQCQSDAINNWICRKKMGFSGQNDQCLNGSLST